MRTPADPIGYGLGIVVQDLGDGRGTVYHHNGGAPGGYGALMYSSPDGSRTLTAGLATGNSATDPSVTLPAALDILLKAVF
jgi:D-alanyl-D-alanine carboxypeptidase